MNMSESINELAKALVSAQADMSPVEYDSINPYYKSKYASLGSLIDRLKEVLPKHGLSYMQLPISEGWMVGVENIVLHTSGQWVSQKYFIPIDGDTKNPIQESGKALTYARRYGLAAMFGLYADEDIDANTPVQQSGKKPEVKSDPAKPIDEIIKEHWLPLAKMAEELKIEFDPLPPAVTEDELRRLYVELKERVEGAK